MVNAKLPDEIKMANHVKKYASNNVSSVINNWFTLLSDFHDYEKNVLR